MEPLESRQLLSADSVVVFNEIFYHPTDDDSGKEWIELHNQMAVDTDVSEWRIEGGVEFTIPDGTIIPGRGYLVIAADTAAVAASTGFPDAIGPFDGVLSNGGERLELYNNDGRFMDGVEYDDEAPWPVAADGGGSSLAKLRSDQASHPAENWVHSDQIFGTPGHPNFPEVLDPIGDRELVIPSDVWKTDDSGVDRGTAWKEPGYDDSAWNEASAITSPLLVSEIGIGDLDFAEIQNVTDDTLTTTGWILAVNNFREDVSGVIPTYWNLPNSIAPQETLHVTGDPDDPDNYLGDSFHWRPTSKAWAMILDDAGRVADFIVWGYTPEDLAGFDATINGHRVTGEDLGWVGESLPVNSYGPEGEYTLKRTGASDRNNASDWAWSSPDSIGEFNPGLATPFENPGLRLSHEPTTTYLRTTFDHTHAPHLTDLTMSLLADDGAVVYLNGVEVYRQNMPDGPISFDTLASSPVGEAQYVRGIRLSSEHLREGENVLAVEVHQAADPDTDMLFGLELTATLWPPDPRELVVDLALNETAAAGEGTPFWVELINFGDTTIELAGASLSSSAGEAYELPAGALAPGATLLVTQAQMGFVPAAGEKLFLHVADGLIALDGAELSSTVQARQEAGPRGRWLRPDAATPDGENTFSLEDAIVINEIMYHFRPLLDPEYTERDEEWIELYNRSDAAVDLTGWALSDAVEYEFEDGTTIAPGEYVIVARGAPALQAKYPGLRILGEYSGTLSNSEENLVLLDPVGNPADEVRYYDGRPWPEMADGGGSSLELKDPDSDNSRPEAWAASDESAKSEWLEVSYRGISDEPLEVNQVYNEFLFHLVAAGEFLIDDLSVLHLPGTASEKEMLQNGTFEDDAPGAEPAKWRLIGTHSGEVIVDPSDPSNKVLKVASAGAGQYVHDHAETTFVDNTPIRERTEYEISFRVRWLSGAAQINSRLYFTRLSQSFVLPTPENLGTPGAQNSAYVENYGPTFADLAQGPVLPASGEPVDVAVRAADPDGIASVKLWYNVDSAETWTSLPMTLGPDGFYRTAIPGQARGKIVQFYVEGQDALGATATWPGAGVDSRALYQVDDGKGTSKPVDEFRLILTPDDHSHLFSAKERMSNDRVGATIVVNGRDIYYDIQARQTGSRFIRPNSGYKINLNSDQPFRGIHESIWFDIELLHELTYKQIVNRAGGSSVSMYDDLAYLVSQQHNPGSVLLNMARYGSGYLESVFEDGPEGGLFELDDITYPTNPNPSPEGEKTGTGVSAQDMHYRGDDKELYRGQLLIKSNREKDDYDPIVQMIHALSLNGDEMYEATNAAMDVDLWMRHYATQSYLGNWDTYGFRRPKNLRIYIRPEDGKVMPLYWDADRGNLKDNLIYNGGASRLDELRNIPQNKRLFWGHMVDLVDRSFNAEYADPFIDNYASLVQQEPRGSTPNFAGQKTLLANRASQVHTQARAAIPAVAFEVTTNGGDDFSVDAASVTLDGNGWIDVREIRLAGQDDPLEVTWTDQDSWQIVLPLDPGANEIKLEAYDFQGRQFTDDAITVTSTVATLPPEEYLRISELYYEPAELTPDEVNLGFTDKDQFEFLELFNVGGEPIDLSGLQFTTGVTYVFPAGSPQLAAGERVVLVADQAAFLTRYPGLEGSIVGDYDGQLSNGGEQIVLLGSDGTTLFNFEYDATDAWPGRAEGKGASLVLEDPAALPRSGAERTEVLDDPGSWNSSVAYGGTPAASSEAEIPIVVNEVLTRPVGDAVDVIELYNAGDAPIDVAGWWLSDSWGWEYSIDDGDYQKFQIPARDPGGLTTVLAPGAYVTFTAREFNATGLDEDPNNDDPKDFGLSGLNGDDVWLMAADGQGDLTHFVDHVDFRPAVEGETFGRWPNGEGVLYPMTQITLGSENSGPRVGPVVISEVMYNPVDPDGEGGIDPADLEFLEIYNPTAAAVDLTGWQIDGGVDYAFEPGTSIAPGGRLVVTPFNPSYVERLNDFLTTYQIDASTPIVGGYDGRLDDGGEKVRLLRLDTSDSVPEGTVVETLEDEVDYDDEAPWPTSPDGGGDSLTRAATEGWGHDPLSFVGLPPTPGTGSTGAMVVGRHVFYAGSASDEIAPDKEALLPGQTASFENYTSYSLGLSGLIVDLLGAARTPQRDDFVFRTGTDGDPAAWVLAPEPSGFEVLAGQGAGGSDRIAITWDVINWEVAAVQNAWLQTTLAGAGLGLDMDDVFYFGNAVGETGDSATEAVVDGDDESRTRANLTASADLENRYDFDRDGRVDAVDLLIVRQAAGDGVALPLIAAPAPAALAAATMGADEASAAELAWLFEQQRATGDGESDSKSEAVDLLLADWP